MAQDKQKQKVHNLIVKMDEVASSAPFAFAAIPSKEQRHQPIPRSGFEQQIPILLRAIEKGGLDLQGYDPQAMIDAAERAENLGPLVALLRELLDRAEATRTADRGEAWRIFTMYYSTLSGLAAAKPDVELALEPLAEFFSNGPRAKKIGNTDTEEPVKPAADTPKVVNG